jgi:hypothetical protein
MGSVAVMKVAPCWGSVEVIGRKLGGGQNERQTH